ncbi:hypothetical protein Cgig2_009933 [Carnegiea gigantea]|uniref:Avr9/Cf-9 rapidly elicited protein n=1 Tax=Carnegiea gigantea TaxID=171969 RepID=A0A9Q1Q9V1_9CARY|nr:hypothetical protein Cgig2_009933 [Carnegiea gigantea]
MKTPGGVASKILLDLSLMMKKGKNKIAGRGLRNLMHHHSSTMHGGASREYEFSCSNTPFYHHYFTTTTTTATTTQQKKRRNSISMPSGGEIESSIEAVDRVLERIRSLQSNKDDINEEFHDDGVTGVEEMMFGSSQDQHVDEAAEEFIKRFYSQLKQQPSTPLLL